MTALHVDLLHAQIIIDRRQYLGCGHLDNFDRTEGRPAKCKKPWKSHGSKVFHCGRPMLFFLSDIVGLHDLACRNVVC